MSLEEGYPRVEDWYPIALRADTVALEKECKVASMLVVQQFTTRFANGI